MKCLCESKCGSLGYLRAFSILIDIFVIFHVGVFNKSKKMKTLNVAQASAVK